MGPDRDAAIAKWLSESEFITAMKALGTGGDYLGGYLYRTYRFAVLYSIE